jgi:hypothetical protein
MQLLKFSLFSSDNYQIFPTTVRALFLKIFLCAAEILAIWRYSVSSTTYLIRVTNEYFADLT